MVFVINVALFLLGAAFLGRSFAASTIFSTIAYPLAMSVLETLPPRPSLPRNPCSPPSAPEPSWARARASSCARAARRGGSDVIALVAHKYLHAQRPRRCSGRSDACVIAGQIPFSNFEQTLLGVLSLTLLTIVMNRIMVMGRSQVQLLIFSSEHERIREKIMGEQDAGVTVIPVEQGYTRPGGPGAAQRDTPTQALGHPRDDYRRGPLPAFWVISEVSEMRERDLKRRA